MIEIATIVFLLTVASVTFIIALLVYIDMRKERVIRNGNRNFGFDDTPKLKSEKRNNDSDKYHERNDV